MSNYVFGRQSKKNLAEAHEFLRAVARRVIDHLDISAGEAYRGRERQEELFRKEATKVHFPDSKHNKRPSEAIHFIPPTGWPEEDGPKFAKETAAFYYMAGVVLHAADEENRHRQRANAVLEAEAQKVLYKLRWGGDWDGDKDFSDQTFDDLSHFEISGELAS